MRRRQDKSGDGSVRCSVRRCSAPGSRWGTAGLRFVGRASLIALLLLPGVGLASPEEGESDRLPGDLHADAAVDGRGGPGRVEPSARQRVAELYAKGREAATAGRFAEAAQWLEQCISIDPEHGDARVALGWALYRSGQFDAASSAFAGAAQREPKRPDAWTGLGYSRMQEQKAGDAAEAFLRARALAPNDPDVLKGLGLLRLREGRADEAADLLSEAVAASPADADARSAHRRALAASGKLKDRRLREQSRPAEIPRDLNVPFRAGREYLELRREDGWEPLFVKGVNLGVALPGKFPSEFPETEEIYADWLAKIRAMNANVVRLYTLLPPQFYSALAKQNMADPDRPIYLVQGVWVELPDGDDFSNAGFNAEYVAEIRRVIDAVHGNIDVAPRAGHASGLYEVDVSPWLLGFILGREWEPFSVLAYDRLRERASGSGKESFEGRYVSVKSGTPTECWIASTMEETAAYLAEVHGSSRPLAFTNWPTLDPLRHPTEATREEEDAIFRKLGVDRGEAPGAVYDNDAVTVDANRIRATRDLPAGVFASYHVYPYYPDFLTLDPGYLKARDAEGPNAFAGYLRDLVRYHRGIPVMIAETGVPTSRGVSHTQPQGFDHGGHTEQAQARIDARLVRSTHETGCAGVIVFSWVDEWFKHNWLVTDLETPREHDPLWLNALDPEENFGILGAYAGREGARIVLGGGVEDWRGVAPVYGSREGPVRALYAAADEAYLYLRLEVDPGLVGTSWSKREGAAPEGAAAQGPSTGAHTAGPAPAGTSASGTASPERHGSGSTPSADHPSGSTPSGTPPSGSTMAGAPPARGGTAGAAWIWWIGIDTYDRALGSMRIPGLEGALRVPSGLEFAVRLSPDDPRILVAAPYDIGSHRHSGPYASVANEAAHFVPMIVEMRMARAARDGTLFPSDRHDRSPLRRGSTDPSSPTYDSLADFELDAAAGVFELRLPWNILNVTDPSTRRVVHQPAAHPYPIDTTVSEGFRFYVAAVEPGASRPAGERPAEGEEAPVFAWPTWDTPTYTLRPKPVYDLLKTTFAALSARP